MVRSGVDRRARDKTVSQLMLEGEPLVVARHAQRRRRPLPRAARPLCLLALVLGSLGIAVGVVVQATPQETWRQPLTPGTALTVPARAPLSGPLVVYGTPRDGTPPSLAELGCRTTDGGGPVVLPDRANENRLVVEGRGVLPLATFPGRPDHSISCSGPAAEAAAPLYVAPGHTSRHLVPVAAYSTAALLLPVGVVGLLTTRAAAR
ncbi:MAG: hypothetical protein ACFCVG_01755 [Kineosporiaceae bacterium]